MKIFKIVFSIIGIVMLFLSFYLYRNTVDFLDRATKTTGKVNELKRVNSSEGADTYKPIVTFYTKENNLIEHISSSSSNPPSYSIGEVVDIYYLEDSPYEAKISGFPSLWLGSLITGILGFIFFSIGFGLILNTYLKKKKKEYLQMNGIKIATKVTNISINTSLKINNSHPYMISSQWQNPSTLDIHIFTSDNIWFNPTEYTKDEITVLIERNNPKKYYMDISFLPELSN